MEREPDATAPRLGVRRLRARIVEKKEGGVTDHEIYVNNDSRDDLMSFDRCQFDVDDAILYRGFDDVYVP